MNPAIWLSDRILAHNSRTKFLADKLVFILDYLKKKNRDKIFEKFKKNIFWCRFWSFLLTCRKKGIFLIKRTFFSIYIPIIYRRAKSNRKLMSYILEKCWANGQTNGRTDGQTDRQTDRQWCFYRTFCWTGIQLKRSVVEQCERQITTAETFV